MMSSSATVTVRTPVDVNALVLGPAAEKAMANDGLNRAQAAAAFTEQKTTLVLGPPGTGKTTTLVERIGHLLDREVKPERIFCATFTGASAAEIITRVNARHTGRLVAPPSQRLAFGTLNSLGGKLLKVLGPRAGFPNADIPKGGEHIAIAKKLGIDLGGDRKRRNGKAREDTAVRPDSEVDGAIADVGWHGPGFGGLEPPNVAGVRGGVLSDLLQGKVPAAVVLGNVHDLSFLNLVARWGGRLIFPDDAVRIAEGDGGRYVPDEVLAKRAHQYKRYKEALYAEGLIDFADQIALPVKILRERADLRAIIESRFDDVLGDEYQDVNASSGALFDLLAGGKARLWCVGDPDQTLYGFNGSDPKVILDFAGRWPDAQVIALEENYRSRPTIVAVANTLIAHNKDRYETKLRPTREPVFLPQELGILLSTPNLQHPPPRFFRKGAVEVAAYPDDVSEARDIARKVSGLIGFGVNPSQIAILCRSGYRAYITVQALRGAGVRIKVLRGQEKSEPEESQLVEGVLRGVYYPATGVGRTDLDTIRRMIGGGERGQRLLAEIEHLRKDGFAAPGQWPALVDAVEELVGGEGPREKLGGLVDESGGISQRWVLRVKAAARAALERGSYEAWCASAGTVGKDNGDANGGGVAAGVTMTTLGTIHGVKGLEYDHVFILGLEGDVCPDGGDLANEEERRLIYVACTRARDTLTVSWAARRSGDRFPAKVSPYIEEGFWRQPGVTFIDYGVEGGDGIEPPEPALDIGGLSEADTRRPARRNGGRNEGTAGAGLSQWAQRGGTLAPATAGTPAALAVPPEQNVVAIAAEKTPIGVPTSNDIGLMTTSPTVIASESNVPFWLGTKGGEDGPVWWVWLVTSDDRTIYDSLINPHEDPAAYQEAAGEGVDLDALRCAPDIGAVTVELRTIMDAFGNKARKVGRQVALHVDADAAAALGITEWEELVRS